MSNKSKPSALRWSWGKHSTPPPLTPPKPPLSTFSSGSVADSAWASSDFMLGVGMVIIQQNTHKIVVIWESKRKYWFFPRGRKDIGETLEKAALREAHEESGYRAEFLPLIHFTRQPPSPDNVWAAHRPNVEPIFITFKSWQPRKRHDKFIDAGGEYLITWYAGQIPEGAEKDVGTGMPDELHYESHLLTYEDAMKRVWGQEADVLRYVWEQYVNTLNWHEHQQVKEESEEDLPAMTPGTSQ